MEGEKAATQAPKSVEEKEINTEPAADSEEKKAESSTHTAAPSKKAEAVDDKKSEQAGESADAAEKSKVKEESKSPSDALDEKKSEATSEPMDVDESNEEPKDKDATSAIEVVGEEKSEETNEPIDDARKRKEEPKEESKLEPEVEPASEPKVELKEEPTDKEKEEPTDEEEKEESTDEDGGADADTKRATKPIPKVGNTTGRGMRQRKLTQAYQPVVEKLKKERVIPKGKGEKLKDMPRVVANFKAVTWSDPDLNSLYTIVFGKGKRKEFKDHLLEFNGLVYPEGKDVEAEQNKVKLKMYKLKMDGLKSVMDLADIDRSAESFGNKAPGKEELCIRFLGWLENPKANGKRSKRTSAGSAGKGSSKTATPAKKAKKKTPAKKTPDKKTTPGKKSSGKKASAKKATTKAAASASPKRAASPPKTASPKRAKAAKAVDLNIPGVDLDKLREKVKNIVEKANRKELTVKMVRKMLEDWLDTDLSKHKDAIRSLVMEVM